MKNLMGLVVVLFVVNSCYSTAKDSTLVDDNSPESLNGILEDKDTITEEQWWESFDTGEAYHNLYKGSEVGKEVSLDDLQAALTEQEVKEEEEESKDAETKKRSFMEELEEDIDVWNAEHENVALIRPRLIEERDEATLDQLYKEYTEKLEKEVINVDHHRELLSIWERQYAAVKAAKETLVE